jgi:hypothetical protein
MFHITDPEFAETIGQGTHLPWPPFVTECAVTRGIAGRPSVFVRGIPVAARPCPSSPPSSGYSPQMAYRFPPELECDRTHRLPAANTNRSTK